MGAGGTAFIVSDHTSSDIDNFTPRIETGGEFFSWFGNLYLWSLGIKS
jgi:hypothetical protein